MSTPTLPTDDFLCIPTVSPLRIPKISTGRKGGAFLFLSFFSYFGRFLVSSSPPPGRLSGVLGPLCPGVSCLSHQAG